MDITVESKTRISHGRCGAGRRMAGLNGAAGLGGAGPRLGERCAEGTTYHFDTQCTEEFSKARTNEIQCKPHRGTRRAVDERFITGTMAALPSWPLNNGPTPFLFR